MIERTGRIKIESAVDTAAFKEFESYLGSFGGELHNLTRNLTVAGVAVDALKESLRFAKDMMVSSLKAGLEWGDDIRGKEREIGALSTAVGGLADSLSLAAAREKLMGGVVDASEQQVRSAAKAAVEYSRKMNVDMRSALETVSDRLVGGRGLSKLMRELGIEFHESQNKIGDIQTALQILDNQFGETTVKAENQKEQISQLGAAWEDLKGQMGDAILGTDIVNSSINLMTLSMRGLTNELKEQGSAWDKITNTVVTLFPGSFGMGLAGVRQAMRDAAAAKKNVAPDLQSEAYDAMFKSGMVQLADDSEIEINPEKPKGKSQRGRKWMSMDEEIALARFDSQAEWEKKKLESDVKYYETQDELRKQMAKRAEEAAWVNFDEESARRRLKEKQAADDAKLQMGRDDAFGAASSFLDAKQMSAMDKATAKLKGIAGGADMAEAGFRRVAAAARGFYSEANSIGVGALQSLYTGLVQAADAALTGQQSFIQGAGMLVKSILYTVGTQCGALAIKEYGLGLAAQAAALNPLTPFLAPFFQAEAATHFSAAGTFALMSAGGFAGGLGMAALGVGATGGGGSAGASSSSGEAYRPSVGQDTTKAKVEVEKIIVKVTYDRSDPGAERYTKRRVRAEIEN